MQNIYMFLFVEAPLGNLFHLAFCCFWGMTLFSRSLHKWEKITLLGKLFYRWKVGYMIFQTWKCSGLTVMADNTFQSTLQCLYKEYPKFDRIPWPWMLTVFFMRLSNVPVSRACSVFRCSCCLWILWKSWVITYLLWSPEEDFSVCFISHFSPLF